MNSLPLSRRHFLTITASVAATAALWQASAPFSVAANTWPPPIALFSKVYQELNLNYDDSASLTAEAGLDGIDCPARPGGQVLPERAADDLPRYAEVLKKRGSKILLLTTAILNPTSPHAETILRTARDLGVKYYRLGYWRYKDAPSREQQLVEVKAQLRDLAALNKELGMCGIYQNHSNGPYVGAKVSDMYEAMKDLNADQVAIAFDPAHAFIELGDAWRTEFDKLRSHFKIAYVKDAIRSTKKFVRFGEGDLGRTDFFKFLKTSGYQLPISMHTEYEWAGEGNPKTRPGLLKALQTDLKVLKGWLGYL